MLITAFLKAQGRASIHFMCTGAGQGSTTQHSAISTEKSIINLNIIATIFKGTNVKFTKGIEAPAPFVVRRFHSPEVWWCCPSWQGAQSSEIPGFLPGAASQRGH